MALDYGLSCSYSQTLTGAESLTAHVTDVQDGSQVGLLHVASLSNRQVGREHVSWVSYEVAQGSDMQEMAASRSVQACAPNCEGHICHMVLTRAVN